MCYYHTDQTILYDHGFVLMAGIVSDDLLLKRHCTIVAQSKEPIASATDCFSYIFVLCLVCAQPWLPLQEIAFGTKRFRPILTRPCQQKNSPAKIVSFSLVSFYNGPHEVPVTLGNGDEQARSAGRLGTLWPAITGHWLLRFGRGRKRKRQDGRDRAFVSMTYTHKIEGLCVEDDNKTRS